MDGEFNKLKTLNRAMLSSKGTEEQKRTAEIVIRAFAEVMP